MRLATTLLNQRDAPLGHAELRRIDIVNQHPIATALYVLIIDETKDDSEVKIMSSVITRRAHHFRQPNY